MANTEESVARYVSTGSPGHSANVSQEQHIVETPHDKNELERRKILEAAGLADSDDDETNETIQPQARTQNLVDTWRTRFSGNEPGAKNNRTAVCHTPN